MLAVATLMLGPATPFAQPPGGSHLPAPRHLSGTARALLHERMQRHAGQMEALGRAVITLDYRQAQELGADIAAEPMLARPLAGNATELNSSLPERFFQLQDALRASAREVSAAAAARNPDAMGDAYGRLARTCVSCHSTYLQAPTAPR
jgi:hypothetical protein